jgi:hypothetical protein
MKTHVKRRWLTLQILSIEVMVSYLGQAWPWGEDRGAQESSSDKRRYLIYLP